MTLMSFRGVKESGRIFAMPTYFFIAMMLLMIVLGFIQWATARWARLAWCRAPSPGRDAQGLAFAYLILRAFSSGTTALTGVEAISNGITAFKQPFRSRTRRQR